MTKGVDSCPSNRTGPLPKKMLSALSRNDTGPHHPTRYLVGQRRKVIFALIVCASGIGFPNAIAQQNPQPEATRQTLKKVEPLYPAEARRVGLKGNVRLDVKISADGNMASYQVLGGSPVFVTAAVAAVKQWQWKRAPGATEEIVLFKFANP